MINPIAPAANGKKQFRFVCIYFTPERFPSSSIIQFRESCVLLGKQRGFLASEENDSYLDLRTASHLCETYCTIETLHAEQRGGNDRE